MAIPYTEQITIEAPDAGASPLAMISSKSDALVDLRVVFEVEGVISFTTHVSVSNSNGGEGC